MKLYIPENGEFASFEIEMDGARMQIRSEIDNYDVDVEKIAEGKYSLIINNTPCLVEVFPNENGMDIAIGHRRQVIPVLTEREKITRELFGTAGKSDRGETIKAPMPGLILKVEVEKGQSVQKGDPLLVMEAMKMENEIRAESGGEIEEIRVTPGNTVEKGAILIKIGKKRN